MGRIIELSSEALASPANAFFAIGDHQNLRAETALHPLNSQELKDELHFYLLFCDRLTLVAEDLLLNEQLTQLLLLPEYHSLFTEGIFVPLLRSHYDTLEDVKQYLTKPDLYNPVGDETWISLLKKLKQHKLYIGRFDENQSYSNFTEIARYYMLNPSFMAQFGAGQIIQPLSSRIDELRKQANRTEWRRSLFFYYAKELEKQKQKRLARTIRHISSVLYTAQFCGQFKQLPAFPSWYNRYLKNTTGISPRVNNDFYDVKELKRISLQFLSSKIKPEAGKVHIQEILRIRESSEFRRYNEELKTFNNLGAGNDLDKYAFAGALVRYLQFLDQRFGEISIDRHKEKRKLQQQISILDMATPVGAVISVSSLILSELAGVPLSKFVSPIWSYITLSFFAYKRLIKEDATQIEIEAAKFWSSYCSPNGTFAATLTSSLPRISKQLDKSLEATRRNQLELEE